MSDKGILVILVLIVLGGVILLQIIDERKKSELVKRDNNLSPTDDLLIKDGEVYIRYMSSKEYKRFKKRVRVHKKLNKRGVKGE